MDFLLDLVHDLIFDELFDSELHMELDELEAAEDLLFEEEML